MCANRTKGWGLKVRALLLALLLMAGVSGCGGSAGADAKPPTIPNFVNLQLNSAMSQASAAGVDATPKDATGNRAIVAQGNWVVVRQDPAAGQTGATVTLYASKKTDLNPPTSAVITTRPEPKTFVLTGTLTLKESQGSQGVCTGSIAGYEDISMGTAVTVYNQAGDVVATGELGDGKFTAGQFTPNVGPCVYEVRVPDVPVDATFYQVEISHRGKLTLPAADAKAGLLAATLG